MSIMVEVILMIDFRRIILIVAWLCRFYVQLKTKCSWRNRSHIDNVEQYWCIFKMMIVRLYTIITTNHILWMSRLYKMFTMMIDFMSKVDIIVDFSWSLEVNGAIFIDLCLHKNLKNFHKIWVMIKNRIISHIVKLIFRFLLLKVEISSFSI